MPKPLDPIAGDWTGPRPAVSVVVLTLNEEVNIGACLASCAWCDDVQMLDSGSTDRTGELARSRGASVHVHPFESFGAQRNWAIDHIPLKHDWVFHIDADERFTSELVREIDGVLARAPAEAGFYVANQMILMDTWIRHASGYPTYQMRLFHRARMRFTDHGHGQREAASGAIGTLRAPYLHLNFSKGVDEWLQRHERYAALEARQILGAGREPFSLASLFSPDPIARRRTLKRLTARIPFRPTFRRLYTLLILRGILDGRAGWTYASLLARYERMTAGHLRALRASA